MFLHPFSPSRAGPVLKRHYSVVLKDTLNLSSPEPVIWEGQSNYEGNDDRGQRFFSAGHPYEFMGRLAPDAGSSQIYNPR